MYPYIIGLQQLEYAEINILLDYFLQYFLVYLAQSQHLCVP